MESYFGGIKISRRLIVISMCVVLVFAYVSPFSDFAIGVKTYFKSLGMSKEELREEVVKNYIYFRWRYIDERIESRDYFSFILIPKHLSNEDIIQAVGSGNILSYLKEKAIFIKGKKDIDQLNSNMLNEGVMIAIYSKDARALSLTPTKSIQRIDAEKFDALYRDNKYRMSKIKLNDRERMRGFGNNFFSIQFEIKIDLTCCDGEENYRGKTPEMEKVIIMEKVKKPQINMLVVSNSGDILERKYGEYTFVQF